MTLIPRDDWIEKDKRDAVERAVADERTRHEAAFRKMVNAAPFYVRWWMKRYLEQRGG